jgi:hypothetical protein
MSPNEFITYFEAIAKNNRAIGHIPDDADHKRFYRFDFEELTGALNNRFKGLSLVIEHPEDREEDNLSDNPRLIQFCAFWIVAPIGSNKDFDAINAVREKCYTVSHQVYTKLRNDSAIGVYKGFKRGTFQRTAQTDMSGTVVGYRCSYTMEDCIQYTLNPDEWFNETPAD